MAKRKPIDKELVRRLYYDEGKSLRDIAAKVGVGSATVRKRMEEWGMERRSRNGARVFGDVNLGVDDMGYVFISKTGTGSRIRLHRLLAVATGVDPHDVFSESVHIHHKSGVPWDNRPDNLELLDHGKHLNEHFSGVSPEECDELKELTDEYTHEEIGEMYGVSGRVITKHINNHCRCHD